MILAALVCLVVAAKWPALVELSSRSFSYEWTLFKRQFSKTYTSSEEEARRFANFIATNAYIKRHNADPRAPYKLGLNHMSDWSSEELDRITGLRIDASKLAHRMSSEQEARQRSLLGMLDSAPVPEELDWRTSPNRVSAVQDQGQCASSWAFSAAGLLEGQQIPQNIGKSLVPLSAQDLLDCCRNISGCEGGFVADALDDIYLLGGIQSTSDYAYVGRKEECHFNQNKSVMTTKGPWYLYQKQEEELKKVVASYGPVATAMWATEAFKHYSSGIWRPDDECKKMVSQVNLNVLIVGYGTDPNGGDFWIVKNSWGVDWGEEGFFKIERGSDACSIDTMPIIALF